MKPEPLLEIVSTDLAQIDAEAGVIRGVKILGRVSRNGREYSPQAMQQAARMYEGLAVNLNHAHAAEMPGATPAENRTVQRAVEEGFGWLEAVRLEPEGVFGDLHFLKEHPHAGLIIEAARRRPDRFGLSHHALGRVVRAKPGHQPGTV
jgi:hypothetical protein